MANFYNPFSQKPDYASGLSDVASQIVQFLALSKMGNGGGGSFKQRMGLPGAQTPQMPKMPQMGMGGGLQGNMMAPGKGGAPTQRKANPINTAPGASDIQTLMGMLSPQGQSILIGLLQQGTFKPITSPSTPGTPGR